MRAEDKAKNLDAWARYFKKHPDVAAHYANLADEMRGHMPPDTRPECCEDGCEERAVPGTAVCGGHYVDGVL